MYDLIPPSMKAQFNLINKPNQSIKLSVNVIDQTSSKKDLLDYKYNKIVIFKYSFNIKNSQYSLDIYSQNTSKNHFKKTIIGYQKFIKENFKFVGDNFAYEARSIHYNGKNKAKGIYGNASKEDIKELKDEGIDTQIIPWIDENEN